MKSQINMKPNRRLPVALLALAAVLGLVAAACGTSGSRAEPETAVISLGSEGDGFSEPPGASGTEAALGGQLASQPTQPTQPTQAAGLTASQSSATQSSAAQSEPDFGQVEAEPSSAAWYNDADYDVDSDCFAQNTLGEDAATRQAKSILADVEALFPEVGAGQAKALAIAFTLCGVELPEVRVLLQQGELGSQYRQMVTALAATDYMAFVDAYTKLPCIIGAHDLQQRINTDSRLIRLIDAVSMAALISFQVTNEDLEQVARNFMGDLMTAFEEALEAGTDPATENGSQLDSSQGVPCEEFMLTHQARQSAA